MWLLDDEQPEQGVQVIITTLNTARKLIKNWKLDLRSIKSVVFDEVDDFWSTDINKESLQHIVRILDPEYN